MEQVGLIAQEAVGESLTISLADRMNLFHNHFRYEFDRVYKVSPLSLCLLVCVANAPSAL
mgnify:CR=1 FL=1